MVDYDKATGSTGTMRIRDNGSVVSLMIISGQSATWFNGKSWSWYLNGSGSGTFDYPSGNQWKTLRSGTVTTDQTVKFNIGATGTTGMGGPTNHSAAIKRSTPPGAPRNVAIVVGDANATSVRVTFQSPASNGGAAIDNYYVRIGTSNPPSGSAQYTTSGNVLFSNMGSLKGSTIYARVQAHNAKGWGTWSGVVSVVLRAKPLAPTGGSISEITHTSVVYSFKDGDNNGASINGRKYRYATTAAGLASATVRTASSNKVTITGLSPGKDIYVEAQNSNVMGDSGWGARANATTQPGTYVRVAGEYKLAIPYVKVNGAWVPAVVYAKRDGSWRLGNTK